MSQSRVSQLLRALEGRIGARLLDRTSRRVRLTPLGERFLAELRPAYDALSGAVEGARGAARGLTGVLRVGFQGAADERVMAALAAVRERHPGCEPETVEIPMADPFGAVREGEVDAAIVCLPVEEPELVLGPVFSRQPQTLLVRAGHRLAAGRREPGRERGAVDAEELADCPLVAPSDPAPRYWREFMAPPVTPDGRPIPRGPRVRTLQEGLTAVAAGRGGMLLCAPTAEYHGRRDITPLPVTGLPDSMLGLVWRRGGETARIRALRRAVEEECGAFASARPDPLKRPVVERGDALLTEDVARLR
ncbi:putative transcriptional regulator [Streptomyces himastatinicus ATCC 53653]|uniref:Putative transcriptional regulator n=1 Tax=Streptomyces himastatinicus ATCC 53653 TaxID=457427 RepID=D9WG50_9ACTN|nr:putative transcriptional regulator [Streptomyces himastatinicus ATCC 53653]